MEYVEVTESKQYLLLLVGAVLQLIQTSNYFHIDQRSEREIRLLAYHKTKQTELLNQLYEVVLLKANALSAYDQSPCSSTESKQTESMELSIVERITDLLNLAKNESPNEEFLQSVERLREKLIPVSRRKKADLSMDQSTHIEDETHPESSVVFKMITKTVANPLLQWSINDLKGTNQKNTILKPMTKKINKKNNSKSIDHTYMVRIGSKDYSDLH